MNNSFLKYYFYYKNNKKKIEYTASKTTSFKRDSVRFLFLLCYITPGGYAARFSI